MITTRIDNITDLKGPWKRVDPPAPKSVKIELTARCDFQCFFCATKDRLRDKSDIDWDFYCRILKEMRAEGVEEIGLFYLGESFLYPRLAEAVAYAKQVVGFPYVFLTTNGRRATEDRVKAVMEAGLDSLKFSFNSYDPEDFARITRVKASEWEIVIQNIKAARRVRDENGFSCGIYASSIERKGEEARLMSEAAEMIIPFVDEHYYLPLYGQAGLTAGAMGTKPVAGNPGRLDAMRAPLPCWSLFTEGHITFDGRLSACCFDHDGRFHMGDLHTTPFMKAWHSEPFQKLRDANLRQNVCGTACEKCIAYQ